MSAFKCRYKDPRCEDDPCPRGIRWLCEAEAESETPADHTPPDLKAALAEALANTGRALGREDAAAEEASGTNENKDLPTPVSIKEGAR